MLTRLILSNNLYLSKHIFSFFGAFFEFWVVSFFVFIRIIVAFLTCSVNYNSSFLLIKEFHWHRLRSIHVLLKVYYNFLMDFRHFRAQSFLAIYYTVPSVLLLVRPYIFDAHTRTEQIILQLLFAKVVDSWFLVELNIIQHFVFIILKIIYNKRRCHPSVSI